MGGFIAITQETPPFLFPTKHFFSNPECISTPITFSPAVRVLCGAAADFRLPPSHSLSGPLLFRRVFCRPAVPPDPPGTGQCMALRFSGPVDVALSPPFLTLMESAPLHSAAVGPPLHTLLALRSPSGRFDCSLHWPSPRRSSGCEDPPCSFFLPPCGC